MKHENLTKKTDPWVVRNRPNVHVEKTLGVRKASASAKRPLAEAERRKLDPSLGLRREGREGTEAVATRTQSSEHSALVVDLTLEESDVEATIIDLTDESETSKLSTGNIKSSMPSETATLHTKNLNFSAGGSCYEKASSRRARHRLALMQQSTSRDEAVPLQRGGARGPGSATMPKERYHDAALEELVRRSSRSSLAKSLHRPPSKSNKPIISISNDSSYAALMAGQIIPMKTTNKRGRSENSRQRLHEKLLGKRRR